MTAQEMTRRIRIKEWSTQIDEFNQSGLTVKQWCEEIGIHRKTYYYRLKRIREEIMDTIETVDAEQMTGMGEIVKNSISKGSDKRSTRHLPSQISVPVFTALPMPGPKGCAVSVRMGEYTVEIHNSADGTTVEQVLRAVSRL